MFLWYLNKAIDSFNLLSSYNPIIHNLTLNYLHMEIHSNNFATITHLETVINYD